MWSRRFLRIGIASSVAAAFTMLVLMRLLLGLPIQLEWKLGFFSQFLFPVVMRAPLFSFGLLALLAYPLCWYWVIFRARSYERAKLNALVFGAYALGWIAIAVCYYPVVMRDALIVREQFGQSTADAAIAALKQTFTLMASGAALLLLLYTIVAFPVAALQRMILLRMFPRTK
jgi:hypothetical protein